MKGTVKGTMKGTMLALTPLRMFPVLMRNRFLLGQLAWRAFSARYAGSYLGWLWTPLTTIVQSILYIVVFSAILKIKADGLGIDLARRPSVGFGVFLVTGLVPYLALNDVVLRAARVFRSHVNLVQRVRLPLEVLVLGDLIGTLLHHMVSFVIVVTYCLACGHLGLDNLGWLCLGVVLFALWVTGLSLIASVLGAALPDVPEFLTLGFQVVFYGAPIIYPLSLIKNDVMLLIVEANPLTPLIGVLRAGLIGSSPPTFAAIAYLAVGGCFLLTLGAAAIERWRTNIPDLL